MGVHTLTEKGKSLEYFKIFGKNTIFNEHPVPFYNDSLENVLFTAINFILVANDDILETACTFHDNRFDWKLAEFLQLGLRLLE